MADLAAAALGYAARGIAVFPLLPRSKAPLTPEGYKDASSAAATVRRWWAQRPDCNIGIATGLSAGFWVLDVDGEEAEVALAALEAQHGRLPVTVQQMTGRGRHICFRWDPSGPEIRNRSKVGGAAIDVRGNGGYIVAPPSIHPGDEKKGVEPGRIYAWCLGRAPDDLAFADAPPWLVELCRPRDQVAVRTEPAGPRAPIAGRATRYGEVVLDACLAAIQSAQKGARDSTLYRFACKAAGLSAGGHIERGYLRDELVRAGRVHVPDAMTFEQLERQVERALAWGDDHAWGPDPDSRARRSATPRAEAATPVQQAIRRADSVAVLEQPRAGNTAAIARTWFHLHGLDPQGVPGADRNLRIAQVDGRLAWVLGLRASHDAPPDGLAVFGLGGGGACSAVKGLSAGRAGVVVWPADCDQLLVATNLADAMALGQAAFESGDPMAVAIVPRLSAFAGGPLGDRWGRVRPEIPQADPKQPAWTVRGLGTVYLAVRRDLAGPELKVRKALGGTKRVRLAGDAATRFWGGLAAAAWRAAGANAVRILTPPGSAAGFCDVREGVG